MAKWHVSKQVMPNSEKHQAHRLILVLPPDHKGLVTCNTDAWLNVEAMQHLHDIIDFVIGRVDLIPSVMNHSLEL